MDAAFGTLAVWEEKFIVGLKLGSINLVARWLARLFCSMLVASNVLLSDLSAQTASARTSETVLKGKLEAHWNTSLLAALKIEVSAPYNSLETVAGFDKFAISDLSTLSITTFGHSIQALGAGTIYVRGGYTIVANLRTVSMEDFTLRRRSGSQSTFDVITKYGETPFYVDNLLTELGTDHSSISVRTMDLRISAWFASVLGKPEITGWALATMRLDGHLSRQVAPSSTEECPRSNRWPKTSVPGHVGQRYEADVFMQSFTVQLTGCNRCSGPSGLGQLKLTPTTILRNSVNDGGFDVTVENDPLGTSKAKFAADIPWRNMFSASCAPYYNDQHPYLTWSLYRINRIGQLEQLARAGIKHAHTAQNGECVDNPGSNHILGRGCGDVYGAGDNDAADALGPRTEIIPLTGQWGRCGSVFDPKCTGTLSGFPNADSWNYRLLLSEADVDVGRNPGTHFMFEAWYVVRDDVDPYNSMAHEDLDFSWHEINGLWSVTPTSTVKIGSVIDEWVDPNHSGEFADSQELKTQHGRIKIAVRATLLNDRSYRYDYAVMNVDFAIAKTTGKEPNLRILSTHGVNGFSIPISIGENIRDISFADADQDPANDWTVKRQFGNIEWSDARSNELTWGTLFRFSLRSNLPPSSRIVHLKTGRDAPQSMEIKLFQRNN